MIKLVNIIWSHQIKVMEQLGVLNCRYDFRNSRRIPTMVVVPAMEVGSHLTKFKEAYLIDF